MTWTTGRQSADIPMVRSAPARARTTRALGTNELAAREVRVGVSSKQGCIPGAGALPSTSHCRRWAF